MVGYGQADVVAPTTWDTCSVACGIIPCLPAANTRESQDIGEILIIRACLHSVFRSSSGKLSKGDWMVLIAVYQLAPSSQRAALNTLGQDTAPISLQAPAPPHVQWYPS